VGSVIAVTKNTYESFATATDGITDDQGQIQVALNTQSSNGGGNVYLPAGTYAIGSPIVVPSGCALIGCDWKDGSATILKVKSGFSGTKAVHIQDGVSVSNKARLANLTLDGNSISGPIVGVLVEGKCAGVQLHQVRIQSFSGDGFKTAAVSGRKPISFELSNVVAYQNTGIGFNFACGTDSTLIDCYALGNGSHGFSLTEMCNSRFIGCRAEWSTNNGFYVTGSWLTGTGSGAAVFAGCSTDRNNKNGVLIDSTGNATMLFSGLQLRRDGRNAGSGGGSYAGLAVSSATSPVVVDGITCYPGVDDDGTGTNSPQYGVNVSGSTYVTVTGGYVHAATTAINDGGTNTTWVVSKVGAATGTTSSPTRVAGNIDTAGRALGAAQPRDHGLLAWTADPATVSAGSIAISGTIYLAAVYVPRAGAVTKIWWNITNAAVTPTAGQNEVGLYDSAGTRLASANVDSATTGTGNISTTISSTTLSPGFYWIAFVFHAATLPTLARSTVVAGIATVNQTAAASRFGTIGTGTTLPSTITPSSISSTGQINYWAGLS
jgi:hypothetical protein